MHVNKVQLNQSCNDYDDDVDSQSKLLVAGQWFGGLLRRLGTTLQGYGSFNGRERIIYNRIANDSALVNGGFTNWLIR